MFDELRLLYPTRIYPGIDGGFLRSLNLGKLALKYFNNICIFSMDEENEYDGKIDGIYIMQDKKYSNFFDKISYYSKGLFSENFYLKSPKRAFSNENDFLLQLEDPLFYNLVQNEGIKKYVLDEHNIYWELLKFPAFQLKSKIYNNLVFHRNKSIEIKAIRDASHELVCSDRDKQVILRENPKLDEKISIIPNCVDFSKYQKYSSKKDQVTNKNCFCVIFIGLLSYPPNLDALYTICNKIAPNFGDNVKFIIIGKNQPNISRPKNVNFLGYVEDIKRYIIESDICIAPLRYGSGTRLKILEYMAIGKPVISTTKGAEGIDFKNGENIIIQDDLDKFSETIRDLLADEKRREKLGKNARDLIKLKYDWQIYQKSLFEIYESLE
jgi:polysaccharide biosynthesis protein PslH